MHSNVQPCYPNTLIPELPVLRTLRLGWGGTRSSSAHHAALNGLALMKGLALSHSRASCRVRKYKRGRLPLIDGRITHLLIGCLASVAQGTMGD